MKETDKLTGEFPYILGTDDIAKIDEGLEKIKSTRPDPKTQGYTTLPDGRTARDVYFLLEQSSQEEDDDIDNIDDELLKDSGGPRLNTLGAWSFVQGSAPRHYTAHAATMKTKFEYEGQLEGNTPRDPFRIGEKSK